MASPISSISTISSAKPASTMALGMVGTGRGARLGILVKSGAALQTAGAVDTVVFDKTGTLTHGKPELTDIVPLNGGAPEALLALAAGAEANSEHPLARAVTVAAKAQSLETPTPEAFEAVPGRGVAATLDGQRVVIGTPEYLAEQGAPLDAAALASVADLGGAGKTVVAMTETKKYAGKYVGNDLACTNCHFDGGRSLNTITLVGVGAAYPLYRSRRDYATDLTLRTQGCFERSMNQHTRQL